METARYLAASQKMGTVFVGLPVFIANALDWLAAQHQDFHLEYHEDGGWQASTCYASPAWGEEGWVRGEDGSVGAALCVAVELTERARN